MENIKSFISKAVLIDTLIKAKIKEIEHLKNLSKSVSSSRFFEMVNGGSKKNKIEELVIKIIDYENQLNDDIDNLINLKKEIKSFIELLEDKELISILSLKYLCFYTFNEISDILKYSERQIYRLHKIALQKLKDFEDRI